MNKTYVALLLDETGSMESYKKDTIGGFNNFLIEQKASGNNIKFSLTLFNSSKIEKRYVNEDISKAKELCEENYKPSNLTPLWDAIGTTINEMEEEKDVLFVILTDGHENASKEFRSDTVKDMIKKKQEMGWQFLFLGADLSDFNDALNVGININVNISKHEMQKAYSSLSQTISTYATKRKMGFIL